MEHGKTPTSQAQQGVELIQSTVKTLKYYAEQNDLDFEIYYPHSSFRLSGRGNTQIYGEETDMKISIGIKTKKGNAWVWFTTLVFEDQDLEKMDDEPLMYSHTYFWNSGNKMRRYSDAMKIITKLEEPPTEEWKATGEALNWVFDLLKQKREHLENLAKDYKKYMTRTIDTGSPVYAVAFPKDLCVVNSKNATIKATDKKKAKVNWKDAKEITVKEELYTGGYSLLTLYTKDTADWIADNYVRQSGEKPQVMELDLWITRQLLQNQESVSSVENSMEVTATKWWKSLSDRKIDSLLNKEFGEDYLVALTEIISTDKDAHQMMTKIYKKEFKIEGIY